ncbi:lipoyl domain-containing protein [Arthrobacter yangruifuii]|uniref:lipoyl domain-containing protein n=1 Tax=Arthrobacter yangruifuii TaxID=2606616 RepID=UPI0011B4890A|nr:lipoyl domain-containing protein [Arthrobacter yangruifuii]
MNVLLTTDFLGDEGEAELTEWLVEDGEEVTEGQPIAELETSKTSNEITAPCPGTISLTAKEGDIVSVDESIATIS